MRAVYAIAAAARNLPGSFAGVPPPRATAEEAVRPARKLSYQDKLELEQMEARIAAAEEHVRACQLAAQDPAVASRRSTDASTRR